MLIRAKPRVLCGGKVFVDICNFNDTVINVAIRGLGDLEVSLFAGSFVLGFLQPLNLVTMRTYGLRLVFLDSNVMSLMLCSPLPANDMRTNTNYHSSKLYIINLLAWSFLFIIHLQRNLVRNLSNYIALEITKQITNLLETGLWGGLGIDEKTILKMTLKI